MQNRSACGHEIPEGARFCPKCGLAPSSAGASAGGYIARRKTELASSWQQRRVQYGFAQPVSRVKAEQVELYRDVAAKDLDVSVRLFGGGSKAFLSYALHHVGIGCVRLIRLSNRSGKPSQNLIVEVGITDFSEPWQESVPVIAPGATHEFKNIRPPVQVDRLREVSERHPASLKIVVRDRDQTLYSRLFDIDILAYNEWLALPGLMETIAVYVQPNSRALQQVIDLAVPRLEERTGSRAFSGYQSGSREYVLQMILAIHEACLELDISYINPPPSFETTGQKLRLVADTLEQRRGTCIDLAILQAALWENVGLNPVIVLVPGHAFLACWLEDQGSDQPSVNWREEGEAAAKILAALNEGTLIPVNSVEIAGRKAFEEALKCGQEYLRQANQAQADVHFIDVVAAHRSSFKPLAWGAKLE